MKKRTALGLILIILGVVWLLESMFIIRVDLTLIIIASFLGILYYLSGNNSSRRSLGLLIAASVVLMVGIHSILNDLYYLGAWDGILFFFLLGSAFWLVYFLHTRHVEGRTGGGWPSYVGWALYAFAGFIYLVEYVGISQGIFKYIWPIALIVVGLLIVLRNKNK
ncbi:MAG: hypothetical protein ACOC21_01140 [Halanaerobiales bacterium]